MKGKIIIGMIGVLIIGLLIISGCSFESSPNKEPFGDSKIKCKDGRIVPISGGCDAEVPDEKPEQIYTIDDFASECMDGNYEIYAEVMEKYKGGDCECPEGALCGLCIPFDRLVLGDDFAREEFNMLDEQDRLIWDSLSVGEIYLFVVKDGKIISAEKEGVGKGLMEHKKRCSLGPAYYQGVVTDFYVCESAGEGVVYKCEGPDYATLKSSGEELRITNIDKGALRKLVIGWEYVFTFKDGRFVDAVKVDGEAETGNLKDDVFVNVPLTIPLQAGKNEYIVGQNETINVYERKIRFIGTQQIPEAAPGYHKALLEVDNMLHYRIAENSEVMLKDCIRVFNKGITLTGMMVDGVVKEDAFVILKIEKSDACGDAIGIEA